MKYLIPVEIVENKIFVIRGCKVMVDRDLAELYEVETKYLNRQVKRNIARFPPEFMFRLTKEETQQLVTNCHQFEKSKHSSVLPKVFTEHGVAMLASVLKSNRAIEVSVLIVKAFIKLRELISSHKALARKIDELEKKYGKHEIEITVMFKVLKKLLQTEEKPKRRIGFQV